MNVLKFASAFVAFLIGSGYASGQEIMQFFTAYGIWSIGGLLIALVLFAWLGKVLMNYGHRHRDAGPDHMADQGFVTTAANISVRFSHGSSPFSCCWYALS
ncbi:MAG: hypothetical protein ACLTQI_02610 [Slackia sp.]